MRKLLDRILRSAIKLCMLTGVTFLVTACYAPAPDSRTFGEDYAKDKEELDQRLLKAAQQNAEKDKTATTTDEVVTKNQTNI